MSFDKPTRNLLAKTVAACRERLAADITDQLQTSFGLYPDGTQLDVARTEAERRTAEDLRALLAHYESNLPPGKDTPQLAYQRLVRDAGFTLLNRLAALRLCEERGLVIECVRQGMESDGFRLFDMLANGALGNRYQTYRAFLERMFDELARDLGALFDRSNPLSQVFPSEAALTEVLALLNDPELARRELWTQDETIGWMYQYYNDPAERKKMREESQAPRNSRELAVRNQFFTPRYVVEFLTDNTLGRLWMEMRGGQSVLKEECRYLVDGTASGGEKGSGNGDPAEGSPKRGAGTASESNPKSNLTPRPSPERRGERPQKDPRDLKILDPACGSGHFLLYAFNLLLMIYEEAWADPNLPPFSESGTWLARDYPSLEELRRALPELILRHNLYGVDIDPRAAQIASLALWLRAQRAWQAWGVPAGERPQVRKTNVVVAEPMPGDARLLEEFLAELEALPFIKQLVRVIFEKMKLAGEAGSLLKIEADLREAIAAAKEQWLKRPQTEQMSLWAEPARPQAKQLGMFDLSGIPDEQFWQEAEGRALEALREYARRAENGKGTRRKLFAGEAEMGFAFVDLCQRKFDVVLMNPPFGEFAEKFREVASEIFAAGDSEIFAAFVERGGEFKRNDGYLGAISSRTAFFQPTTAKWRKKVVIPMGVSIWVELGGEVLDSAVVETVMYVLGNSSDSNKSIFIRPNSETSPEHSLVVGKSWSKNKFFYVNTYNFNLIPQSPFAYWLDSKLYDCIINFPSLDKVGIQVKVGLQTGDDFRFVRTHWEVPPQDFYSETINAGHKWVAHAKGGENSPYATDIHLVVNWDKQGVEIENHPSSTIRSRNFYLKQGLTFSYRTSRFSPAIMPKNCIPGVAGMGIFAADYDQWFLVSFLNSSLVREFLSVRLGRLDMDSLYQAGIISPTPFPKFESADYQSLISLGKELFLLCNQSYLQNETTRQYLYSIDTKAERLISKIDKDKNRIEQHRNRVLRLFEQVDQIVATAYGLENSTSNKNDVLETGKELLNRFINTGYLNELELAQNYISNFIGISFGRWDVRYAIGEKTAPFLPDPFVPLPICPPGMLQNEHGMPAAPEDVPVEYPLPIPWDGILVDDPGLDGKSPHPADLVERVRQVLRLLWPENHSAIEAEACEIIGVRDLRDYFRKPGGFFADHLKRYSKSRRQAPIYWPLSTASGAYTLWLYYPRLSAETLPTALNRFVDPKIAEVEKYVAALERQLTEISGRAATDLRDKLDGQKSLLSELRDFRAELMRISALPYQPDLNDGVILNAAPFHRLFRLSKWSKDTESAWKKLQGGEYEWSHIAYVIWPERVREACKTDKSIAIAHGLESLYVEVEGKKVKGKRKKSVAEDEEEE